MTIFTVTLANGIIFFTYCIIVSYIILEKRISNIKNIFISLIPFLFMYYFILCLLESIYAIFFSGLCAFLFIKIIFKESLFVSMLISLVIHVVKNINKMILLAIINKESLLLINTYKTLDWNVFLINLINLTCATIIILIFKKYLRKLFRFITNLPNRRLILLISIYVNFILIYLYQQPYDIFSIVTIKDFFIIFTISAVGIMGISSEMKMESLTKHYQEIFEYSKINEELVSNYKMQVHENRNKLLIKGLLKGSKKDLEKYINNILNEAYEDDSNYWLAELRYIPLAGVRNFINYKLVKLKELGAEIEVFVSSELQDINTKSFSDRDYNQLTTILGIILDNMIDSIKVSDEKLVCIYIRMDDNKIIGDYVNSYSEEIDLSRLNEIGYSTKGKQRGVGLPLVQKIIKANCRFECETEVNDKFFIQHFSIKLTSKQNLQKTQKINKLSRK